MRLFLEYYINNMFNILEFVKFCLKYVIKCFIFSFMVVVYGEFDFSLNEESFLNFINFYGVFKMMSERILLDIFKIVDFKCVILRYFNVVGVCMYNDYIIFYMLG